MKYIGILNENESELKRGLISLEFPVIFSERYVLKKIIKGGAQGAKEKCSSNMWKIVLQNIYYNPEVVMGKRSVGNVSYSEQLFQGPDFSELCEYNGHCGYSNCRFRHYGENPRDKLKEN